CLQHYGYPFTF
nr:immunoglobulin light chain junction region [Macaca mulatta]